MASNQTIATVLAYLHELYQNREVTPATGDAWSMAFADWDDAELLTCARKAATSPGRSFFPTPGEIAAFRVLPVVDASTVLRRISALGAYNPNGWLYPSIETVRDSMGEAVAQAYAAAGAERCFADDDSITQDIARRSFASELGHAQKQDRHLLGASTQKLIGAT